MAKQFTLTAILKEEETGYSVLCPEFGVASQGETFEEAIANIREAPQGFTSKVLKNWEFLMKV